MSDEDQQGIVDRSFEHAEDTGPEALPAGQEAQADVMGVWKLVTSPEAMPAPPDGIVKAARQSPDRYFVLPDPFWVGGAMPPPWAFMGRWRSDSEGNIVSWEDNEEYRPSPEALGWRRPVDAVDAAVQLAVTRYGPVEAVAQMLAVTPELNVFLDSEGQPDFEEQPDGTTVLPVSTLAAMDNTELPPNRTSSLMGLIDSLNEDQRLLYLSPTSPASMIVTPDDIRRAARELAERQENGEDLMPGLLSPAAAFTDEGANDDVPRYAWSTPPGGMPDDTSRRRLQGTPEE
ncbi:type VII secretion system-associated protein [Streptomyces sp. NPDC098781]|uniref:type VII secretion system-associated protein n=1 Tax=Streptomyces sp. NPDC098781 TaxID=3366097 RepID=UPI0037F18757